MACPARAMPEAGAQSAALERCVPGSAFLRLGIHTSSSGSRTQQSLHGVATAVRLVNQGGLLAEWNTTIVPFFKPILDDPIWTNAEAVKVSSGARGQAWSGAKRLGPGLTLSPALLPASQAALELV